MNLLYIWNETHFGTKGNAGYLLSSRYRITFARDEGLLCISRRESLSEGDFWGEHIYDVMAVVGNNGAGKTKLAYCIMDTLDEAGRLNEAISDFQSSRFPFLLVFEDRRGWEPEIKIFAVDIELAVHTTLRCNRNPSWDDLKRFKFAYFTDTLTLLDYEQEKGGVISDNSLGGGIRKAFTRNRERHYIDTSTSPILNYFDDEMGKILEFVCLNQNEAGIPFVLPKAANISTKRYQTNLEDITQELKDMGKSYGGRILKEKCREIEKVHGINTRSALAIHLMLNLFKDSCISQTSSDDLQKKAEKLLEEIDRLDCRDKTEFDMMLRLLERLSPTAIDDWSIMSPYVEMVLWLKEQRALRDLRNWEMWRLDLSKDRRTIEELYRHYRKTRSPYPYLSISFGLSAGEYALLRRFVQLDEMLAYRPRDGAYVVNNPGDWVTCNGLMLYFDEVDQSMHPEWQRKQLDWLLQFVSARFKTCESQLVIATHSPIVLSDIPHEHVLYLRNSGGETQTEQRETRTFGSNIHTLFQDAFFLSEGTMGAFAERKINEIAQILWDSDGQVPQRTVRLIEEIGDDVIRNKLQQMWRGRSVSKSRPENRLAVEETIRLLRNQIERLEAAIRELEHMKYD